MDNADWLRRSQAAVWHPCTQMRHHAPGAGAMSLPLLPIARADGPWLIDCEGHRLLDAISSWWTNLFGHNHPLIKAALIDQLDRLDHVMLAGCTHPPVIELSERLAALTGHTLGHAFYASDGASATEIALKMSVQSWANRGCPEKNRFLCLANSYHGETVGALAVTDQPIFRTPCAPLLRPAATVPSPDARSKEAGESAEDTARRAAQALAETLRQSHGQIAALIVEPLVQGAAGMAMYDPVYLVEARRLCDHYGVHLIFDEIAVGFGRTGQIFAHEAALSGGQPVRPDLLCLSKGITGGTLPLSVVLASDAIYQAFWHDEVARGFLHSHSYTGNPLACRAALATLDLLARPATLPAIHRLGEALQNALSSLAQHPAVRHFRACGTIVAFDVRTDDPAFSRRFYRAALAAGVLLRPIGQTVYVMPPYVLGAAEIDLIARATRNALDTALQGG